ncbi:FAD-dependent oxidoreductase [Actinomadura rudentiformis]|uniref:Cholesterol oxidase n=1 Tax=Actinomadura rudentiformis TaxID=359158 RepID=A0A6H9YN32_9ACTN|nr:GMC family oxidoreductase [Actinomadura rudentiformis]KAB2348354.1 GMC family oxidoreductase [Actinomadura rudentiformis]
MTEGSEARSYDYDVIVVGSGFGGSVAALRLAEKGYRVAVLEAGRRFDESTLPKTSWRLRRYLWAPRLGLRGIQRMHLVGGKAGVLVLAGAGVGGGSLVYANTLYEPLDPFYTDRQWGHITDWRDELAPFYDQAKRMLGVTLNPLVTPADEAMQKVAKRMGVGGTWHATPVGVFFGDDRTTPGEETDDPYFGGAGPRRSACTACGSCMVGCKVGAKNTLVKNYLYLAEQAGVQVLPDTTVTGITPIDNNGDSNGDGGGYEVEIVRTQAIPLRGRRRLTAEHVVLAAGTYGTQQLLHRMRASGRLPNLSSRLGELTRTNSEALLGVERMTGWHRKGDVDHSTGLAITSSFHPDDKTHIEPTRYGPGDNLMGLIRTLLIDGGGRAPRWAKFLVEALRKPGLIVRALSIRDWSKRTIIALVMQTADNSITVTQKRRGLLRRRRLTAQHGIGEPNPTWIPIAHDAVRLLGEELDAQPGGTWFDLFNIPTTAHFLGGCVIGDSPDTGVIDPYHRVYGHPGLHIVDGSAVTANLGVNPSLTITAQAERAMALWPNRGERDARPSLGSPYERLAPMTPRHPAVPAHAPAARHQ